LNTCMGRKSLTTSGTRSTRKSSVVVFVFGMWP